jgi:hypothetical protein
VRRARAKLPHTQWEDRARAAFGIGVVSPGEEI